MNKNVYIVDGARTPFLKSRGVPGPFSTAQLAIKAARPLLLRQPFSPTDFDEVILGCVMPAPTEMNIARVVSLRLDCGDQVTAWTVQRNCGSGMQALDTATQRITAGTADLIMVGGVESMSRAPLLLNNAMVHWLGRLNQAKTTGKKLATFSQFRLAYLKPVIALLQGLTDPVVGLSMGKTAEIIAHRFNITRQDMDAFAAKSHVRLAQAQQDQHLDEIEVIYDKDGKAYTSDDGVRPDSTLEALAQLKPVFDRPFGQVTAGNSAQISDGAACLILASEEGCEKYGLTPKGKIIDCCWQGLSPAQMGLGPAYAIAALLKKKNLTLADIDLWEINEAFAAQVIACLRALQDREFCQQELAWSTEVGVIEEERLNIHGGAISLGHPVGASGARIVLQLLNNLELHHMKTGIASLCVGGGQGGAMLLESCHGR